MPIMASAAEHPWRIKLLDYSLRELGGKQLDNGLSVAVRCDAETSAIEYRLESSSTRSPANAAAFGPSVEQLLHDLRKCWQQVFGLSLWKMLLQITWWMLFWFFNMIVQCTNLSVANTNYYDCLLVCIHVLLVDFTILDDIM
ncbi:uncharacterized protein LOC110430718 isoform X1 [Sorghum bicolor]|uniref:uncharacterized protein LOC110430718 isoform X1 n=1 Tax=Sorghum bicolor TaxID=4558 RepID=UPI000B4257B8|nr:uncharacterized protein LOC110430718 isoform X1 [Sorghum bicolor]|eukprot:XP_021304246.1 uncharacterized protein LOC110430718 isoform X1 [Sorghum bicolor]